MSVEIHGPNRIGCPVCGSDQIEFFDVTHHEFEVGADLVFWCRRCSTAVQYSIRNDGENVSAVWSDITEDM